MCTYEFVIEYNVSGFTFLHSNTTCTCAFNSNVLLWILKLNGTSISNAQVLLKGKKTVKSNDRTSSWKTVVTLKFSFQFNFLLNFLSGEYMTWIWLKTTTFIWNQNSDRHCWLSIFLIEVNGITLVSLRKKGPSSWAGVGDWTQMKLYLCNLSWCWTVRELKILSAIKMFMQMCERCILPFSCSLCLLFISILPFSMFSVYFF